MPYKIVLVAGTFNDVVLEQQAAGDRALVVLENLEAPDEVGNRTTGADAIVVTNNPLTQDHIAALADTVKIVGRAGVGLDAIDLAAAEKRGLAIYHLPDYATNEVATHTVALILAAHRRLLAADRIARSHWVEWRAIGEIRPLEEQVVGVIGCGRIGRAVISRLAPLFGRILTFDPYALELPPEASPSPSLEHLLANSDILTLHLPWVAGDPPLIGRRELEILKPTATIVNVSRGGLIDETALAEALEAGALGSAALDVLASEPPPADAPILKAPNTLLTPHVGWYSDAAEPRARQQVIAGVLDWLDGGQPAFGRLAIDPPR